MYLQYYMTHAIKTHVILHRFLPPKSSVSQCKPSHVLVSVTVTAGLSHYRLPKLTFIVFCEILGFYFYFHCVSYKFHWILCASAEFFYLLAFS